MICTTIQNRNYEQVLEALTARQDKSIKGSLKILQLSDLKCFCTALGKHFFMFYKSPLQGKYTYFHI